MYVRLAFAVAAHLDSDILFLTKSYQLEMPIFRKNALGKMDDVATNREEQFYLLAIICMQFKKLCSYNLSLIKR